MVVSVETREKLVSTYTSRGSQYILLAIPAIIFIYALCFMRSNIDIDCVKLGGHVVALEDTCKISSQSVFGSYSLGRALFPSFMTGYSYYLSLKYLKEFSVREFEHHQDNDGYDEVSYTYSIYFEQDFGSSPGPYQNDADMKVELEKLEEKHSLEKKQEVATLKEKEEKQKELEVSIKAVEEKEKSMRNKAEKKALQKDKQVLLDAMVKQKSVIVKHMSSIKARTVQREKEMEKLKAGENELIKLPAKYNSATSGEVYDFGSSRHDATDLAKKQHQFLTSIQKDSSKTYSLSHSMDQRWTDELLLLSMGSIIGLLVWYYQVDETIDCDASSDTMHIATYSLLGRCGVNVILPLAQIDSLMTSEHEETVRENGLDRVRILYKVRLVISKRRENEMLPGLQEDPDNSEKQCRYIFLEQKSNDQSTLQQQMSPIRTWQTEHKARTRRREEYKRQEMIQSLPSPKANIDNHSDGEIRTRVVNNNTSLNNGNTCSICCEPDREVRAVFMPCKHMVCCDVCADQLDKCPVCRTTIDNVFNVFK